MDRTPDARSALEPLIVSFRDNLDDPEWVRLWTVLSAEATDQDHPAHAAMVAGYERTRLELIDWLDRLRVAGVIAADVDPAHASGGTVVLIGQLSRPQRSLALSVGLAQRVARRQDGGTIGDPEAICTRRLDQNGCTVARKGWTAGKGRPQVRLLIE